MHLKNINLHICNINMFKLFVHQKDIISKHSTVFNFFCWNVFHGWSGLVGVLLWIDRSCIKFIEKPGSILTMDHLKGSLFYVSNGLFQLPIFDIIIIATKNNNNNNNNNNDCNWTWSQNHLVRKRTLSHFSQFGQIVVRSFTN